MRNHFVHHLSNKLKNPRSENVVMLTGDLGFSVLEPLQKVLGDRFLNVGVAEALMATSAAGIASQGFKAFIYSITPFATFRCLEQIRNDICYHGMDVTVVGVGAGFGYGPLGPTHHALEDLAALWSIPKIRVYSPADLTQAEWAFEENWNLGGPSYLRIGKGGEGSITQKVTTFHDGIFEYGSGQDLTFIATGHITQEILKASSALQESGCQVQVLSCVRLKPFPSDSLAKLIKSSNVIVVEELAPYGGFSGQVSKIILENGLKVDKFLSMSAVDEFAKVVGNLQFQRERNALDAQAILRSAEKLLGLK